MVFLIREILYFDNLKLSYCEKKSTDDTFFYSSSFPSINLTYCLSKKQIMVDAISKSNFFKVKGLTKKICSAMVDNFDVKSIGFGNVSENSTFDVLHKVNLDSFKLFNSSSFMDKSPFLRTLRELNFRYVEISDGDFLDNLIGYVEKPNL